MTRSRLIPFIISLSFFMESMDSTIINTAIPVMAKSLSVYPIDLKIALISYLVSLAIFIPVSGWLADKFGSKRVFLFSLIVFTTSSLFCGFSQHLNELVIARFIQGIGGALGMPVGRLILLRVFGPEQLMVIMNRVIGTAALGLLLGPVIGGVISYHFSWRWIFWINVPVGLTAMLLAYRCLPHMSPKPITPLDRRGFMLFASALSTFIFGLSALSDSRGHLLIAIRSLGLSVVLFCLYAWHAHYATHPLIKSDLLRFRTFRVSVFGNLISRLGFGGIPFLVPLLLQIGLGYSAQRSGLLWAPVAIGVMITRLFSVRLLRFIGYRRALILNTFCSGLLIWTFMKVDIDTPIYIICILTFAYGIFLSLQYSAMNALAYAELSADDFSAATSIMSTLQQLAQSFGVAVAAVLVHFFQFLFSTNLTLTLNLFHYTFFVIGTLTLLSMLIFVQLEAADGQKLLGEG